MQNVMNRRWLLAAYPEGMPTLENWTLDKQPVPDPGPGQILIKAKWLSVDPYMLGRRGAPRRGHGPYTVR
jgi:NADPH-dependent curcumin reductase CurA